MISLKLKINKISTIRFLYSRQEMKVLSGQSLFEVVFAMAVASIVMIGIVSLAASSVRNSTFSRNNALATRYAQETSEWLRQLRDSQQWTTFSAKANAPGVNYCLQSLGSDLPSQGACSASDYIGGTPFIRETQLSLLDSVTSGDTVEAIISVNWSDAQGLHEVRTTAQYTRWQTP